MHYTASIVLANSFFDWSTPLMNPQHLGNDAADIRTRIRINPEIQIRIPNYLVEVRRLGGGLDCLSTDQFSLCRA